MEFFDLHQTIGRWSYFLRSLSIFIFFVFIDFIPKFELPWILNSILFIIWVIFWCYMVLCTAIKRARDLWGSWYIVWWTILLSYIIALTIGTFPTYLNIFLLQYLDVILIFLKWVLWIQGIYLLFFTGKIF